MSKHSLGPWFSQYDDNGFYKIGSEAVGLNIAFTFGEYDTDEANARLIAAAPDLLKVLEVIVATEHERHGYNPFWTDQARAAIAKAKGGL